jgi:diguanylate cyclase (GGDEF)-like protein
MQHLTQLCNRRGTLTVMQQEPRRMTRNKQPVSIILCDIDRLKRVNDQYGHDAGDRVLVRFGEVCITSVREQHTVARCGGDVFLFFTSSICTKCHHGRPQNIFSTVRPGN